MPIIFKSKKFWMAVVGVIAVVLAETLGVNQETTLMILTPIVAYIVGQGLADSSKES
ncbi:hypothetical protein LCGC14_2698680 [marine sediment metagenome]|uniref:Holin n=1 Tax=marine sediment metagenome TaxID=412755 RepID=A0A0F9C8A9_9ZZZZ